MDKQTFKNAETEMHNEVPRVDIGEGSQAPLSTIARIENLEKQLAGTEENVLVDVGTALGGTFIGAAIGGGIAYAVVREHAEDGSAVPVSDGSRGIIAAAAAAGSGLGRFLALTAKDVLTRTRR